MECGRSLEIDLDSETLKSKHALKNLSTERLLETTYGEVVNTA